MTFPYREKAVTCAPGTYKYFFDEEEVANIWELLAARYGPIRETPYIMEIDCRAFFFRATLDANPILVIRKRRCKPEDVEQLHKLIQFGTMPVE